MTKAKLVIFIAIVFTCILIITFPYISELLHKGSKVTNKVVTLNDGEYTVGNHISANLYDIEVISGPVTFMGKKLSSKDEIIGISLNNGENIEVEGSGELKLSPAQYKRIEEDNLGYYKIEHSGFYTIGKQIPEGKYLLSYKGETKKEEPFVQILSSNKDIINTYDFQKVKSYELNLEKGMILEIHKFLFSESKNITVTLEPV